MSSSWSFYRLGIRSYQATTIGELFEIHSVASCRRFNRDFSQRSGVSNWPRILHVGTKHLKHAGQSGSHFQCLVLLEAATVLAAKNSSELVSACSSPGGRLFITDVGASTDVGR